MQEKKTIKDRLQHAWNAFLNRDPTDNYHNNLGTSSSRRPDRVRLAYGNERSIIASIYNRIAIDVAAIAIRHVKLDQNGRYIETMKSGLNEALTLSANIDQTGRAFIMDVVMSMFDEGCVAIIPVETSGDPILSGAYDVHAMRTGRILEWFPQHVRVRAYDERTGEKEDITQPKRIIGIIENPLYAVMNEPNSTLQRLKTKLNQLDAVDEQSSSGKLDIIIQLPYVVKSAARREQAEIRRKDLETQLSGSKYGIAYTDGTEKVTQLNRPADNNLMTQITYLTSMLYSQLGITENVFNGTANEEEMLNYYNRSIEPILSSIIDELMRKFLTKTARTQFQAIAAYRDPFKLVPVSKLPDIVDKFTRNEVLTSNEVRAVMGYKPSDDPKADELRNKNLNPTDPNTPAKGDIKNEEDQEDV